MKILVTGASGMLGSALVETLKKRFEIIGVGRAPSTSQDIRWVTTDILSGDFIGQLRDIGPEVIINCAALTNVDLCETDRKMARALNVDLPFRLAKYAAISGSHLIQISTDLVFDGQKRTPYTEADQTNPPNFYGETKLAGEVPVFQFERGLVLRTNIFGWRANGPLSLGQWILEGLKSAQALKLFTDVIFTPVSTYTLSGFIESCIDKKVYGLFHAGGREALSKHEFGLRVAKCFDLSPQKIQAVQISEMKLEAKRSTYMAMNSSRLENEIGMDLPNLDEDIQLWRQRQI